MTADDLTPVVPNPDGLIIRARDNQGLPVTDVQPSQPSAVERVQEYCEHILFNLLEEKCQMAIKQLNEFT